MTVFRSEEMECYQALVHKSVVYQCIAALGEKDLVEMVSLNTTESDRPFMAELKILDELDTKLRKMVKGVKVHNFAAVTPDPVPLTPPPSELTNIGGNKHTSLNVFYKMCQEYREVSESVDKMMNNLTKLVEKHSALLRGHKFMLAIEKEGMKKGTELHLAERGSVPLQNRFSILVGVIPVSKMALIEILIWRLCQGNAMVKFFDIEPQKKRGIEISERRSVILISVQGMKSTGVVTKLCSGYNIRLYYMARKPHERVFLLNRTLGKIFELRGILNESNGHKLHLLREAAQHCKKWFIEIEKMKMTYIALNTVDWNSLEHHAIITFWVPKSRLEKAFRVFLGVSKSEGVNSPVLQKIHHPSTPPTYIRTNKFTEAFQHIVDAYGIPSYRELNPMPYTVITFPFLFAVMFGDVGHGLIMVTFATTVIIFEKRILKHGISSEIHNLIFKGRYIILLMGLFSIWTGLVYNDLFSQGSWLKYTHWTLARYRLEDIERSSVITLDPTYDYVGYPYFIGLDPIWKLAQNEINFTNAIKMKVAIILGVTQMTFGIILNLFNHLYFKNYLAIFTEFIPRIVFFSCIFIYLVFLFFFKWYVYSAQGPSETSPHCAPSILITFIHMMMFQFEPSTDPDCRPSMYPSQEVIQKYLLLTALSCIPIMFFIEPIVEIVKMKKKDKHHVYVEEDSVISIMVHQFIHVIEFVLGSISYTASYLRLWALSLAHFQLSSVLWDMVLIMGTQSGGIVFSVIISFLSFIIFAMFTIAILVVIEGLSAFLHALRLHWMEFQSKFYIGVGHYFSPFSFKHILIEAKIPLVK